MWASVSAAGEQVADYIELTKPRIALVAVATTFVGMWLAAHTVPGLETGLGEGMGEALGAGLSHAPHLPGSQPGSPLTPALVLGTLLGTWLAAAAAGALNNYIDRDIDKLMSRTAHRATAAGRVHPRHVLCFGLALGGAAFVLLAGTSNLLTAALAVGTILFYVVIYTLWLKRSTDLCTEIGGVAGALPPVIGWAAVTGTVAPPALLLFLIMFLWQPPHFWVLALLREDEYRRAGIPVLPVRAGALVTKAKMLLYTAALLPATIALFYTGAAGPGYLVVAVVATLAYLAWTIDFARRPLAPSAQETPTQTPAQPSAHETSAPTTDPKAPWRKHAVRLFLFSIAYLLVVFAAIFIDSLRPAALHLG